MLGCLYSTSIFLSDFVLPPLDMDTFKAELLVYEKPVKCPVDAFAGGRCCSNLPSRGVCCDVSDLNE